VRGHAVVQRAQAGADIEVCSRIGELEGADVAALSRILEKNAFDRGSFFCFVIRNQKESSDYEILQFVTPTTHF
jgi:hypothetical protein